MADETMTKPESQRGHDEEISAIGPAVVEVPTAHSSSETLESHSKKRISMGVRNVRTFSTANTAVGIEEGKDVPKSPMRQRLDDILQWRHWRIVLHLALFLFVTR